MSRGRGPTSLFAAAVVITFAAGVLRRHVMTAVTSVLVDVPFSPLRRMLLGLLIDLPSVLLVIAFCAIARRIVVVEKPWLMALGLTSLVWLLDLAMALLIADIMVLWTDYFVLVPRLVAAGAAAVGSAFVLGWRPRTKVDSNASEGG